MLRQLLGNVLPYDHNSSSTSSNAQPLRSADNDEQRGSLLCSVFSDDEEELDGEDDGFDVDEIDGAFDGVFFFLLLKICKDSCLHLCRHLTNFFPNLLDTKKEYFLFAVCAETSKIAYLYRTAT